MAGWKRFLRSRTPTTFRGVALVLHPHPLGGGTMHNKVVFRAAGSFE
jgi:alpha/beta superfamily hydrolase